MCTLTIVRDADRLLVTMNRDDNAERPESAPTLWPDASPAFVAPKDLQAGGTWIGVNAYGVIACLLNRYDAAPVGTTSRGRIVLEAMRGTTLDAACNAIARLDRNAYSPFTCIIINQAGAARFDWTGTLLERCDLSIQEDVMLTSSSWRFDEVKNQRAVLFQQVWSNAASTEDRIARFHGARDGADDAWAPMMRRPLSQTKSVTQVELKADGAQMRYWTRGAALASKLKAAETSVHMPALV